MHIYVHQMPLYLGIYHQREYSHMLNKLKHAARTVLTRRNDYIENAKPYADKAVAYAKENPSEIMLGIMTLLLMDIESDVDGLEDNTGISAAVDLHEYRTR